MSYDGNIISAPVSIDDVKQALGESSNDLATLCKSKNIIISSKYKPTNYSIDFVSDSLNSDKKTWTAKDKTKAWWLGEARRYQTVFDFNIVNSVEQAKQLGIWEYNRPEGGSSSPYRLTDFIGYDSYDDGDNNFPFYVSIHPSTIYTNSIITAHFFTGDEVDYPEHVLSADDIFNMMSLKFGDKDHIYLGLFIANETTKRQGCISCTKPISKFELSRGGNDILEIRYDLEYGLLSNDDDEDLYNYGSLLCGKVSKGDIITVIPMMFSTPGIYESYNASFTPGVVFPYAYANEFYSAIYSNIAISKSDKPIEPITVSYKVSNIKFSKSERTVYWGTHGNNSYVVRSKKMLEVSFDLEGRNINAYNAKIKLYGIGNDSDSTYIETEEILFPSTWYGGKQTFKSFVTKGYTYYSQAAKEENVGDDFVGIPVDVVTMQNETTPLNYITKWVIYIQITADSFYDNNNNYIWNFKYAGDVLNENGLIYSETY